MSNMADEFEEEAIGEETEEETQRKKKKKRLTSTHILGESTSSKPTRPSGRKKDEVWKHVDIVEPGRVRCKYCGVEFCGGASRIKEHLNLSSNGGKNVKVCSSYPPLRVQQPVDNVATTTSSSPDEQEIESGLDPILDVHNTVSSPCLPDCQETVDNQMQYSSLLVDLLVNNLPLDTIKKPCFQTLVNFMAHNHEFRLNEPVLLNLETEVEQYIQNVIESWSNFGLTLKVHFRKTRYNDLFDKSNIVGYTAYCPKGVIFLDFKKMHAEIEKHMKNELTQIIYDLDLEKDDCHGASEVDGIMDITLCSNVSLCVQAVIINFLHTVCEKCNWLADLIKEAKRMYEVVVTTTKENPMVESKFSHYPFFELQTIVQHKEQFESVLRDQSETSKFWKDREETLDVIGPLIQILNLFDSFVPNIGYFFEAMEMAEKRIKHCNEAKPEKFKFLRDIFESWKEDVIMPIHLTTAYLNPSYMHNESSIKGKIDDEDVKKFIRDLRPSTSDEERTKLENELAKYSKKDSSLFTEEAVTMLITYHPVTWWKKFGDVVPELRECAIRLLSQPSNCLSHLCHKTRFEVLNFGGPDVFRLNFIMMYEFKRLEESNEIFKPIDLRVINASLN